MKPASRVLSFVVTLSVASGCGGLPMLTGLVTRDEIETQLPNWHDEIARASVDEDAARALADVPPGAEVDVFLGTWCGDSRRVVSRLFVALARVPGERPFAIRFVAVDRRKRDPDGLSDGRDVRFVPTIIVRRAGGEVGRIVESAPHGVEVDLLALLRGEAHGTLSLRDDL